MPNEEKIDRKAHKAYIGLGSNLGNPLHNCLRALALIDENPNASVLRKSPFYQTEPLQVEQNHPWYVNAAVEILFRRDPETLLDVCQDIEFTMGRKAEDKNKKKPRLIDLDILLFNDIVMNRPHLTIPHPEISLRLFVLVPLCDLIPHQKHPVIGKTFEQLKNECPRREKVIPVKQSNRTTVC